MRFTMILAFAFLFCCSLVVNLNAQEIQAGPGKASAADGVAKSRQQTQQSQIPAGTSPSAYGGYPAPPNPNEYYAGNAYPGFYPNYYGTYSSAGSYAGYYSG